MRIWHTETTHTSHGWQQMPINGTVIRTYADGARLIKWDTGRGAVYQSNDRSIHMGEFPNN